MNKSANKPSTAPLSKKTTNVVKVEKIEHTGRPKPETTIRNNSDRNIFLIPMSCTSVEIPPSQGTIINDGAEMIPANGEITVDSKDYDRNARASNSQIYILFRAGDGDDKVKFLGDLRKEKHSGIKLEAGELFELHDGLLNGDLRLTCLEGPVTGDGSAGQGKEKEKDKQSKQNPELNSPSAEVQELEKKIKALQKDMELLKRLFKSFAEGRT